MFWVAQRRAPHAERTFGCALRILVALRNIPALFVATVLTFFSAGSPFISCASEHVDNLGAYGIPSGTGFSSHSICTTMFQGE